MASSTLLTRRFSSAHAQPASSSTLTIPDTDGAYEAIDENAKLLASITELEAAAAAEYDDAGSGATDEERSARNAAAQRKLARMKEELGKRIEICAKWSDEAPNNPLPPLLPAARNAARTASKRHERDLLDGRPAGSAAAAAAAAAGAGVVASADAIAALGGVGGVGGAAAAASAAAAAAAAAAGGGLSNSSLAGVKRLIGEFRESAAASAGLLPGGGRGMMGMLGGGVAEGYPKAAKRSKRDGPGGGGGGGYGSSSSSSSSSGGPGRGGRRTPGGFSDGFGGVLASHDEVIRFRGLCRVGRRWKAQITYGGTTHHLGMYSSQEEAALAYDASARVHHKNASLNFPDLAGAPLGEGQLAAARAAAAATVSTKRAEKAAKKAGKAAAMASALSSAAAAGGSVAPPTFVGLGGPAPMKAFSKAAAAPPKIRSV